jgi:hypothetical protein
LRHNAAGLLVGVKLRDAGFVVKVLFEKVNSPIFAVLQKGWIGSSVG